MILSASRRTDIPAFYSDWFFNRIKEGFLYVRNPMNRHQVSKINLSPDVVDCIVFWSKNPRPMMGRLSELDRYMYYFQFTINPYDTSFEYSVPKKSGGEGVISTFQELSKRIGANRVIWRYDPILLSNDIGIGYHTKYFEELAKRLEGYANTCVISFIDLYKKTQRNLRDTNAREPVQEEMIELAIKLNEIAKKYAIKIQSCSEKIELASVGIEHGRCIDNVLIEDLLGIKLVVDKDGNQRKECGCVQSIDVGEYNTCSHSCKYCYANFNSEIVERNRHRHNPNSPLLIGELGEDDKVHDREIFSFIKIPEAFKQGDFVRLKHPELWAVHSNRLYNDINVFQILSKTQGEYILEDISTHVPTSEVLPIGVDGIQDKWIYYDPKIAASILFPGDSIPTHYRDYSYYLDSFKKDIFDGKSLFDIIKKKKLRYVHEIQHYLDTIGQHNSLRINKTKL